MSGEATGTEVIVGVKVGKKGAKVTIEAVGHGVSVTMKLDRTVTDEGVRFLARFLSREAWHNLDGMMNDILDEMVDDA